MRHLGQWVVLVLVITALTAVVWALLGVARHVSHRITIKLDSGYGWKDAGVLLRRKTRQEYTGEPGRHRAEEQQPPPSRVTEILAAGDEPADVTMVMAAGAADEAPDGMTPEQVVEDFVTFYREHHEPAVPGPDDSDKKPGE